MSKQSLEALHIANENRFAQAALKKAIKTGMVPIHVALTHSAARRLTIYALIKSQERWGRYKTLTLLNKLGISESVRVGNLSSRQLQQITEELS